MSFFEDSKSKKSEDTNYNVNYNGNFDFVFFGAHEDTIYDPINVNFWWPKWCLQKRSSKRSSKKDHLLGGPKEPNKAQATLIEADMDGIMTRASHAVRRLWGKPWSSAPRQM